MVDLLGALRRAIMPTEAEKASRRWRRINKAARVIGCRCGRPATEVRYFDGFMGSAPHETWTCAEHVDVEVWTRSEDGPWVPAAETQPGIIRTPIGDFTDLSDLITRWPRPDPARMVRVGPGVVEVLFGSVSADPPGSALPSLLGLPIVVDPDLAPGDWQLVGSDGAILKFGTITVEVDR